MTDFHPHLFRAIDRFHGCGNGCLMTTTDDATPIRVSGPSGLLATVPAMLGFHPSNSLVLLCLSGDRRRVGPVARVDLPPAHDRALATHLTRHALAHADEVVVVCYQNSRRRPPLLDDVLGELAKAGIDVMDAIVVRGGRARPALSAAMERVHPGIPLPDAEDPTVRALAAAGAWAGRSVLADRDQLRRSIAGPTGKRLRLAEQCAADAAAGRLPGSGNVGPADGQSPDAVAPGRPGAPSGRVPDELSTLIELGLHQISSTGRVAVEVATSLACVLTDRLVRDAALRRAATELDQPWLPLLIACAAWTPDWLAAPVCGVLAVVAYRHGDGALAQIAVDRCLAAEPGHPLAHVMIAVMAAGLRPEELADIGTDPRFLDPDIGYQDGPDDLTMGAFWSDVEHD